MKRLQTSFVLMFLLVASPAFPEEPENALLAAAMIQMEQAQTMPAATLEAAIERYLTLREVESKMQKLSGPILEDPVALRAFGTLQNDLIAARNSVAKHCGDKPPQDCLFDQAVQTAFATDSNNLDFALQVLVLELIEFGDLDRALDLATKIVSPSSASESISKITTALIESGQLSEALQTSELIETDFYRIIALIDIAERMTEAGETERVNQILGQVRILVESDEDPVSIGFGLRRLSHYYSQNQRYSEALNLAESIVDIEQKEFALVSIAMALAENGKVDAALDIIQRLELNSIQIRAFANIAVTLNKSGDLDGARQVLDQAFSIIENLEHSSSLILPLYHTISSMVEVGFDDEALDLVKAWDSEGTYWQAYTLTKIGLMMASTGEIDLARQKIREAIDATGSIADGLGKTNILRRIAIDMAELGFLSEALDAIAQITDIEARSRTQSIIALAFANSGRFDDAITIAEGIHAAIFQMEAFSNIGLILANAGEHELARHVFAQASEISANVEPHFKRSDFRVGLILNLTSAGYFAEALSAAEVYGKNKYGQSGAYSRIARGMAKAGRFVDAYALARTIIYPRFQSSALVGIAAQL